MIRLLSLLDTETAGKLIGGLAVSVGAIWSFGYGVGNWNQKDWETVAKHNNWVSREVWQDEVRKKGWIPGNECPGYPTKLVISSPGQNSELFVVNEHNLDYKIDEYVVVESSRPYAGADKLQVGLAYQPVGEPQSNCYLTFTFKGRSWNEYKFCKVSWSENLSFDASKVSHMDIWAVLVTSENSVGKNYSSIDQIKTSGAVIALSDPIRVRLKLKPPGSVNKIPEKGGPTYRPPKFEGLVGKIKFNNPALYPVTVTLWHPNSGEVQVHQTVNGNENPYLLDDDKKPINVGDDWGVQLGDSKIKPVSKCARWDSYRKEFQTSVDLFQRSDDGS